MLAQLYIKNIALINEVFIEFNNNLNILSGETGAGKSIIIDSINFVLGKKFGKEFINKDAEKANVDAVIFLNTSELKSEIGNIGIEIEEDSSILISRTISRNGKTTARINGKPVTLSMLKEIGEKIIDIHGQHQHQSLLNTSKHIVLLDRFCEIEIFPIKQELSKCILSYREIVKKLSELDLDFNKRDEKIDLLKYQLNEITDADLQKNEDEELLKSRKIMNSSEKLKKLYTDTLNLLYTSDDGSAMDKISVAVSNLYDICQIDFSKKSIYEDLNEIYIKFQDIISELNKSNDKIEYSIEDLNFIENRLELIYTLKKKYGSSIDNILKTKDEIEKKLDFLINSEEKIILLLKEKENIESKIKSYCFKISEIRKEKATILEKNIEKHLLDLGMKHVKFKISIKNKNKFTQNGFDEVEFLISPNAGEELKPLSKIASGGEMSRVMLSLKAVLSSVDMIETFIFDEIDTGVSGRTAQQVAEKLAFLAKNKQIICITHLPQIASMADEHFLIEKSTINEKTTTYIKKLNYETSIKELARMTGGAEITEKTLNAVKEIKQQADTIKKSL